MADADMLATIKTQTLAMIQILTTDPKPAYSIDGQSVQWSEYLSQLRATVAWCDTQLAAQEPFEVRSQGMTP